MYYQHILKNHSEGGHLEEQGIYGKSKLIEVWGFHGAN
jgi:hypothetical protein